ncbi:hypothetical protein LTR08_008811 [Meristemomyces frigidus]|nr:hypothetical protein LTR08_008811 [Meristemomyces frigidus]
MDSDAQPECSHAAIEDTHETRLNKRTVRKLDFILLPFLALLFLLNSLDKTNVGNAESAGFTHDAGLSPKDLNTSLAFFFAFFVALQPVGAALGRKYGMARWVPACMTLWGLCTILHIWVRKRWQLIFLRVVIASLEAGFYPTAVSYLSLFYTRYEFASRLAFFYGQTAVAGALGGVLSWAVFSQFPRPPSGPQLPPGDTVAVVGKGGWKGWELLFLIEGVTTMLVAFVGFFWLPHSANTAWFLGAQERMWAEQRIRLDHDNVTKTQKRRASEALRLSITENDDESAEQPPTISMSDDDNDDDDNAGEAHHRLLDGHIDLCAPLRREHSALSTISVTADAGLNRHDVVSAVLNYKIWHLLVCNILSAIPATAFAVFLPLVIRQLSPSLNLSPAASNLLSAPPFAFGALVLVFFTRWSDRSRQRLVPIFWGLGLLLIGLTITVLVGRNEYVLRYLSLCILLSGSFIASPLTVAWLTNNTPEPGKRAILLGLNGWGNLAGVFSALLFTPEDEKNGYVRSFIVTLVCVAGSFAGFIAFYVVLVRENQWREDVTSNWSEKERKREDAFGDGDVSKGGSERKRRSLWAVGTWVGLGQERRGDEKLTFQYGL